MKSSAGWGLAAVLALAGQGAAAGAPAPWQGQPLSDPEQAACRAILPDLVRPVAPPHRQAAMRRLQSAPWVALSDAQAGAWIEVDAPRDGALADRLLGDAIGALRERRIQALGEHAEKWSPTEQRALDALQQAAAEPHARLEPVLVRAAAGPGPGGTFEAADCGGALAIRFLSPGAPAAQAVRAPVVVFLQRPPARVRAVVAGPTPDAWR